MPGLADILPSSEIVVIRGEDVDVIGIDIEDVPQIIRRFPVIGEMFRGGKLDAGALLGQSKAMVGAVLAAGIGKLGDEEQERGIGNLKLGEKAKLAAAVIRQTMPDGAGPFVELIAAVGVVMPAIPEQEKEVPLPDGAVRLRSTKRLPKALNG